MGVVYTDPPQSRNEAILDSIIDGTSYTDPPQSRIEDLLLQVKEVIEEGGHDESATRASIAPTESDSAHASKNIAVGEQFYLVDDKLYTATSAIAQNAAIIVYPTANYNCKLSDSITEQIAVKVDTADAEGYVSKNMLAVSSMSFHRTNHRVDVISIPELAKNTKYRLMVRYSNVSVAAGDEEYLFIRFGRIQQVSTTSLHPRTDISGNQYFDLATVDSDIAVDNQNLYLGFNSSAQSNDSITVDLYLVPAEIHDNVDLTQNKTDNSVIAPVENGTTVQKSDGYAVGSHAIRNDAFITWKNAKAQGETINDASDYDSGDVAELLNFETGSFNTPATNVSIGISTYMKYGHVMNVRLSFTASAEIARATDIGKCPYGRAGSYNQYLTSIDGKIFYLTANGTIRNDEVLPAGAYTVIGTVMV